MEKLIKTILVLIIVSTSLPAFSNYIERDLENEVLKVSVQKDNLFLHLVTTNDQKIQKVVINLNKGKKIKLGPGLVENDYIIFYLDSKEAYKLKKYEAKSISYFDGKEHYQIKLTSNQIEKISSSLP
jgi:hypothetical protein